MVCHLRIGLNESIIIMFLEPDSQFYSICAYYSSTSWYQGKVSQQTGKASLQSLQSESDLMMNDASHYEDIDIVKLDGLTISHEEEIYKTADKENMAPKNQPSQHIDRSQNEVLKGHQQGDEKQPQLEPLKPYVSERVDLPGKRIFLNLTIATDEGSDSVYTLHVEVPTGGGPHFIKEVLTHEKPTAQADKVCS